MFLLGTQRVNDAGHLEIGGCDSVELAREFGTPLFVMDEAHIRFAMRSLKKAFEDLNQPAHVIYASKAFPCLAMARIADQEGLWIDVASAGELYTALRADFPVERIVFHGNFKSEAELTMAVRAGIGCIICDNERELDVLDAICAEEGVTQPIMLRLTTSVDPHTHRYISTGRTDTKFGMNIAQGGARSGLEKALSKKNLELRGLSCHIGSQILDGDFFTLSATQMCEFLAEVKKDLSYSPEVMDLGGGLGIRYLPEHTPPSFEEYVNILVSTVREKCAALGLEVPTLAIEPGRAIVGEAGTTLYTVGPIKTIPDIRTYVAVDGGISDNPRPALYEAQYSSLVANRANETVRSTVTVAGKHCETDTLLENISIAPVQAGDILAVQSTGAYNHSMASNYNRFRRPAVVLVGDGKADIIVQRETLDDVIAQDAVPGRLRG